jgi:DNA helicase II / ATP-dependent DNA helicase PcrA
MSDFIVDLNSPQKEAVLATEGPVLVLAGAGTGKTRVLTTRIANIIHLNLASYSEILAVTFTNKAAKEMQERIHALCPEIPYINAGTFHSIAAKILRQHADFAGLLPSYNIIDQDDQLKVIKTILDEQGLDKKEVPPKIIQYIISRWKDLGIWYDQISNSDIKSDMHKIAKGVYRTYQEKLTSSNLCDFGDLLLLNVRIFLQNPDILQRIQNKYKYVLIDEYQDTNPVQYLWARLLADKHKNICCVGDDDQSIYSWRGAEVENILRFGKDFPGAKIIALEQNYRSTPYILKAASSLIKNNTTRHTKELWTSKEEGEKISVISCFNEKEEAKFIANYIINSKDKIKPYEIAILVRAGFQTRNFEEAFINSGIQYRIIGGLRFYERMEIKDIVSYIRIIINPKDDVAFERIINVPKRSIGPSTLRLIKEYSVRNELSYFEATHKMLTENIFKNKVAGEISKFCDFIINKSTEITKPHLPADFVKSITEYSGYKDMLKQEKTEESRARLDNLNELIRATGEYESIQGFLEHVSLVMDKESRSDASSEVNLMTVHASKGLEFDLVFMPGMEEGLFPNQKTLTEEGAKGLEEERRIAYVAMTRAKKTLIMLHAESRRIYNEFVSSLPSRFLKELPEESLYKTSSTKFFNMISVKNIHKKFSPEKLDIDHEDKMRPGCRVEHSKFGKGIVLKKSLDNLEVFFDNNGIKTIKESFLKPIS